MTLRPLIFLKDGIHIKDKTSLKGAERHFLK